jgi:hypothetical protein
MQTLDAVTVTAASAAGHMTTTEAATKSLPP